MEIIDFPERNLVIGKDQPEYLPLYAHAVGDESGTAVFCWRLSWMDRLTVLVTGRLWHQVATFRQPLQPQMLRVSKPVMEVES